MGFDIRVGYVVKDLVPGKRSRDGLDCVQEIVRDRERETEKERERGMWRWYASIICGA